MINKKQKNVEEKKKIWVIDFFRVKDNFAQK